jgi:hypothetical protein
MTEYVIRVRQSAEGEYRATLKEVAPGVPLDVRSLPTSACSVGTASTHAAAIVSAVIAARIPDLTGDLTRAS